MSDTAEESPIIDLSTNDAKKRTFRKLLIALIASVLGAITLGIVYPLPEGLQIAMDLESEMVAPWKTTLALIGALALLGTQAWAIFELWHFKASGLAKLAMATFAPFFLLETGPSVSNPLGFYVESLSSILTGMVLLMGWALPSIFQSEASNVPTGSESPASQIKGSEAR